MGLKRGRAALGCQNKAERVTACGKGRERERKDESHRLERGKRLENRVEETEIRIKRERD